MKYTVIAAHNNGREINFRLALCVCVRHTSSLLILFLRSARAFVSRPESVNGGGGRGGYLPNGNQYEGRRRPRSPLPPPLVPGPFLSGVSFCKRRPQRHRRRRRRPELLLSSAKFFVRFRFRYALPRPFRRPRRLINYFHRLPPPPPVRFPPRRPHLFVTPLRNPVFTGRPNPCYCRLSSLVVQLR